MGQIIRSIAEPIRTGLTWDQTWAAEDNGLIMCWEVGRSLRQTNPELAHKADSGELPLLGWQGGIEPPVKYKKKTGSLQYLAQWQGLRGQDLAINPDGETVITCMASSVTVTFKKQQAKTQSKTPSKNKRKPVATPTPVLLTGLTLY